METFNVKHWNIIGWIANIQLFQLILGRLWFGKSGKDAYVIKQDKNFKPGDMKSEIKTK